jgi:hypothetical protein
MNKYYKNTLIKKSIENYCIINPNQNIINMVNYISKIGYKINKEVLNYLLNLENSKILLKNPHENSIIFSTLNRGDKKKVLSHNSIYYNNKNILSLAKLFSDVKSFYYPLYLD